MNKVILKKNREKTVRGMHPWIFSGGIQNVAEGVRDGDMVQVCDNAGHFLAWGFYNSRSQIAVRLFSWREDESDLNQSLKNRIEAAILQRTLQKSDSQSTASRLVYSEGDFLPGLIVDRYADFLVVQFLTLGMERSRQTIIEILQTLDPNIKGIYERSDSKTRKKEGLQSSSGLLWGQEPPALVEIEENRTRYLVDLVHGHKTGFYLDQATNRQLITQYAKHKKVLNCFCYSGGFGIACAQVGAAYVTNIDSSEFALSLAKHNASLNKVESITSFLKKDVFEALRAFEQQHAGFDLIILDPPKLAESKRDTTRAARGYKDLNLLAGKLLNPDGYLATFSCSGAIDPAFFRQIVWQASVDAGAQLKIVKSLTQPSDHPILLSFPEGEYLKGLLLQKI